MSSPLERFTALFSPPRPIHEPKDSDSKDEDKNNNSAETAISPRCQFTFSDGRQCRHQSASLCVHHSSKKQPDFAAEGAPDAALGALCGDLTTATNINRALSQVFLLMAQGRIPQKQAVAFGYITQLLLQTVPGIRSEYVSVHGYAAWENNLKSKITPPLPTPAAQTEPPTPAPPSPDYADLLRRSRDMLDRKYDTTPEGRREANALALELELMNPAPAKPRRDFFSRTVDLVRRVRAHQTKKSQPGSQQALAVAASAPALSSTPVALSSTASAPPTTAATPSPASAPATHQSQPCSSGRAATGAPATQTAASASPIAPKSNPGDSFVAPPSRRPPATASSQNEVPVPGFTLTRTGHSSDWYAPASWSGPQPNPFPSRKERLARALRTMSNSRWRRLQHRNSRAF